MKDSFAEINVVPLVDIMLVLLVIVLMTANFLVQGGVDVSPPKSDSQTAVAREAVRFEVNASGQLFYDKKEVARDEIPLLLHGFSREQPVLISADKALPLQPFVTLLDDIKRLGFTRISLHTER